MKHIAIALLVTLTTACTLGDNSTHEVRVAAPDIADGTSGTINADGSLSMGLSGGALEVSLTLLPDNAQLSAIGFDVVARKLTTLQVYAVYYDLSGVGHASASRRVTASSSRTHQEIRLGFSAPEMRLKGFDEIVITPSVLATVTLSNVTLTFE